MKKFSNHVLKEIGQKTIEGYFNSVLDSASYYGYHPNYHNIIMRNCVNKGFISEEDRVNWVNRQKSRGGKMSPEPKYVESGGLKENPYQSSIDNMEIYGVPGNSITYVHNENLGYLKTEEHDILSKRNLSVYPVAG